MAGTVCNSGSDSKVWMKEEIKKIFLSTPVDTCGTFLFGKERENMNNEEPIVTEEIQTEKVKNKSGFKNSLTSRIVKVALLSTLSFIFYLVGFPLPFFPSFLEIQFSNLPVILGGFLLGPIEGCAIVVVRTILKLIVQGTHTAFVGETSDLIIGLALVLVTSLIYRHHKSRKNGYIALGFGILTWVVISTLSNWLVIAPFYIRMLPNGLEDFVTYLSIIPGVNESNYMIKYLFFAIVPFNLLLSIIVSAITAIVYKKLSYLFKKF